MQEVCEREGRDKAITVSIANRFNSSSTRIFNRRRRVPVEGEAESLKADPELTRTKATTEGDLQGSQEVEEAQEYHQGARNGMAVKIAHRAISISIPPHLAS